MWGKGVHKGRLIFSCWWPVPSHVKHSKALRTKPGKCVQTFSNLVGVMMRNRRKMESEDEVEVLDTVGVIRMVLKATQPSFHMHVRLSTIFL